VIDPSTELSFLRQTLRLAIACAPVLLACTDGESRALEQGKSTDGKVGSLFGNDPKPPPDEPTTVAFDEPYPMPSCPSGQWCGTKALAEPLRQPAGPYVAQDFEGCPGGIRGSESIDSDERSRYGELPTHGAMVASIDVAATEARRSAGEQDACCYSWTEMCPGGRPLLEDGRPRVAELREGTRWTAALPELDRATIARLSDRERRALADAWLADALMEHSSIASFARARRELAAVGAPSILQRGCRRAAVDERRHARVCFGLAAAYGAIAVEPSPLGRSSIRPGGIERVAIDTFIEGCVGETVAAACVRRAANQAHDPALARLLHAIADDEADHAALAWQTLAWAIETGTDSVRSAVTTIADRLRPSTEPRIETDTLATGHGRLDAPTRARVRRDAWATIIDPLLASLIRPGA